MRLFTVIVVVIALAACKKGAQEQSKGTNEVPTIKLAPEDFIVLARGELQTGPRISGTLQAASRAVVRAETQGSVVAIGPELGQPVKKGDRLLVMEAMKMQSTVYSPVAGLVKQLLVAPGAHVEAKDLLLVIE